MLAWFSAFYSRNHTFLLQAFLIALISDQLFFKEVTFPKRIGKSLGAFLLSLNTSMIMTVWLYQKLSPILSFNALSDFFLATSLILLTLLLVIALYQRLINKKASVALFTYCQFVIAAEISSLLANQDWQWDFFTILLTLGLYFLFRKEILYISQEHTVITEDSRFFWSTLLCMVLVVAQAEFPRMFLDGSNSAMPTPIGYVVSILALISCIMYIVFMKYNIFSITRYENYLQKYSDDPLTGSKNLYYFLEHSDDIIKQLPQNKDLFIFYSSLVNLHDYNLANGYQAGTNLLKQVHHKLEENFPETAIVRSGGSHFIGVIIGDEEKKFLSIAQDIATGSRGETLLFKVGLAPFTPSSKLLRRQRTTDLVHVLDQAGSALNSVKDTTDVIGVYNDELAKADEIRVHVLDNIDQACQDNWLKIYYQPLIDIKTMKLAECEALSRWIDPAYGFLSPDKFIPVLEANQIVYKVDCHVLEGYGLDTQKLMEEGREIFPISFNISRTDLEACDIYQKIEQTVAEYGLSRSQVHIEITESALNGSQAMVEAVQRFHDLGYQVWMDDFGSGYSSLNVLKDYNFDVIKIDMVFLRKFDDRSKTIVANICRMAKELGIKTVCEGVETQEQFDFLKEAGCDLAQGFLFSPPVPLDDLYKKMAAYL